MELQLHNGESVEVSEATFGRDFNEALVHQVVTAHLAGARAGTKAQKTRAQVRGGGAKPWRQKGTGRARAGSIRSPIWRSGGRTFAASPRDHDQKVNRKMYRGAMRSLLSELIRQERLIVVDTFDLPAPESAEDQRKTRRLVAKLRDMKVDDVLIVQEAFDSEVMLASRNLPGVGYLEVAAIDPVSLLRYRKILITVAALRLIEEKLA